jgi:hypothetical protein
MNLRDLSARRRTVTTPTRRPTVSRSPPRHASTHWTRSIVSWLGNESLALFALSGAALTVMAQLGQAIPLAPQFSTLLSRWQEFTHAFWRPPLELTGLTLHHDLVAALNASLFMALLGIGARFSASSSGKSLAPISGGRFFDDQTWPSLITFAALCLIFLIGHGANENDVLILWNSKELGKYAFALIVTAGYFAGDFIGHRAFHLRLYRLVAVVAIFVAINFALIYWPAVLGA